MRFARAYKILVDAEMDLKRAALEPAAAARDQLRRFDLLGETENAVIKGAPRPRETLKRVITTLTSDELIYTNPATTTGARIEAVWKRLK